MVRLKHNFIVPDAEGKSRLIARGEVIPFEDVPERWRTDEMIEHVEEFSRDKVMLLHDMSCAVPNFDGQSTVWREKLFSAYSLVDLKTLPNRIVEGMREGDDYLTEWNEDDRKLKETERHEAEETFSMEPDIPEDVSDGRDPHNRYYGESL
jgi:hypothetical protein